MPETDDNEMVILWSKQRDHIVINGMVYACHVFRSLALARPGTWLRIEDTKEGVITIYEPDDATTKAIEAMTMRSEQIRNRRG